MAPKKNAVSIAAKPADATDKNPATVKNKRPAASRVTKAKPLRTPSVVKIKIKGPSKIDTVEQATICETVKADKPIKYERHPKQAHLIELANQVAQFQLEKPKLSPEKVPVPEAPPKKARAKRAKKTIEAKVEEAEEIADIEIAQFQLEKPKLSPEKVPVPEAPPKKARAKRAKKTIEAKVEEAEEIADIETAPPAPKSKKKTVAKPKTPKAPPKPRVRKPKAQCAKTNAEPEYATPKIPKCRAKPKSKKSPEPSPEVQLSPDILNELRSFEVSTTPRTSSRTNTSRSSSTVSRNTDHFSWVKEISSSAPTTPTKELVSLDGRLPEIKLVDYRKSGRRVCKRNLDEIDSISVSTKTSGSSTKKIKPVKNTFNMSQKKFRLSLRKKNNNKWSIINSQDEINQKILRSRHNGTEIDSGEVSSSEISCRTNVDLSSSSTSSSSRSTRMTTDCLPNRSMPKDSISNITHIQNMQDIRQKLDSLDLEFINWLGEVDKELNLNKLSIKSSDILKLEHAAIKECQDFKLRLSNSSSEKSSECNAPKSISDVIADEDLTDNAQNDSYNLKNVSNNIENIPNNIENSPNIINNIPDTNETNKNDVKTYLPKDDILAKPLPLPITANTEIARHNTSCEPNYINDDEDALSIFAESITGIESSKYSAVGTYQQVRSPQCSPICDDIEPNDPDFTEEYYYYKFSSGSDSSPNRMREIPQKAIEKAMPQDVFKSSDPKFTEKPKLACVKKIADSTSVQREDSFQVPNNVYQVNEPLQCWNQSKSAMMGVNYFAICPVKSQVFRGVCFFNLISKCKCKNQCNFPHQRIPNEEIKNRLLRLQEGNFICEYLLVRKYPPLRDSYITIFVSECYRRDLTPILLEMVIDCYREQINIRTHALETALLNISSKNLDDYIFFLNYDSDIIGHKVCEVLMKAIAVTQNFTRFKQVFVKLTEFMVQIGSKFIIDDAGRILERVCILPYDESLASAMVKIVQHTSLDIFKNASMNTFETRLQDQNMDIFNKLEEYKKAVLVVEPIPSKVVNTSTKIVGTMNGHGPVMDKPKPYTSPDTTHFEMNLKNFDNLPRITRTVDCSNNSKTHNTYIAKPPTNSNPIEESALPRPQNSLNRPPQALRKPLLRTPYLNVNSGQSFSPQKQGNAMFPLLSQRFGRDAPFWYVFLFRF